MESFPALVPHRAAKTIPSQAALLAFDWVTDGRSVRAQIQLSHQTSLNPLVLLSFASITYLLWHRFFFGHSLEQLCTSAPLVDATFACFFLSLFLLIHCSHTSNSWWCVLPAHGPHWLGFGHKRVLLECVNPEREVLKHCVFRFYNCIQNVWAELSIVEKLLMVCLTVERPHTTG